MTALVRRRSAVVATAVLSVLLSGAGVGASFLIKSPAQAAAETAPPPADVLTARVERQVLTSTVVTRGQVAAARSVDVMPVSAGAGSGGSAVVTKLPVKAGAQVAAGDPVVEVAGRPVFPLAGELPVYRDLKPGTTGQDVAQLQNALASLGFPVGADRAGTFGEGTKSAVGAFYRAHGYDPRPANADGAAQVAAAEEAVTNGRRALADAKDGLTSAQQQTPSAQPAPERNDGAAARKRVDRATEDLAKLEARLAAVREENGPMVPSGEIVYLPGFPARVDTVAGRVGSVPSGRILTLSAGELVVQGQLTPADKGLVHPGQKVEILSELTGGKATATVSTVADSVSDPRQANADGAAAQGQAAPAAGPVGYRLVVRPDAPLDPQLAGQDVRLTVQAASSAGPVLVVPISAISAAADGRTVVTVYRDGQRRRVEVTPGTVGGGSAEVRPLAEGSVREGDQVIVGVTNAAPAPTGGAK